MHHTPNHLPSQGGAQDLVAHRTFLHSDPVELRRALMIIFTLHRVIEIRAIKVQRGYGRPVTMAGFFDNVEDAVKAILALPRCKAIYFTLNRIPDDMLAICCNRLDVCEDGLTADKHVTRRVLLLIDFDPIRPHPEISSTDAEHLAAEELATEVMAILADAYGWPYPVMFYSGNGTGVWYRIDLPADDGGLIKRVLEALAAKFNTATVKIDTSVHNASRITKLPGTVARKGDHIPARPHRVARIVSADVDSFDQADVVPTLLLEAMAATAPEEANQRSTAPGGFRRPSSSRPTGDAARAALEADVVRWGLRSSGTKVSGTVFTMHLAACPFDSTHIGKDAGVCVDLATGARGFHCFHDHCIQYTYRDFIARVAPGERHPPNCNARKRLISDHAMQYALEHGYV